MLITYARLGIKPGPPDPKSGAQPRCFKSWLAQQGHTSVDILALPHISPPS